MPLINQQQLQVSLVQNQYLPDEGPKMIPLLLDFTAADQYTLDGQLMQANNQLLSILQTTYIDLSGSDVDLTMTIFGTNQIIIAKAGTQGYYTTLAPNPLKLSFDCPDGPIVPIFLMNVPVAGSVWSV